VQRHWVLGGRVDDGGAGGRWHWRMLVVLFLVIFDLDTAESRLH
jgi:hypothetical protein